MQDQQKSVRRVHAAFTQVDCDPGIPDDHINQLKDDGFILMCHWHKGTNPWYEGFLSA